MTRLLERGREGSDYAAERGSFRRSATSRRHQIISLDESAWSATRLI